MGDDKDKPDWRIGLAAKPKYRSDSLFGKVGKVIDVNPSGFSGIEDKHGVLTVRLNTGQLIIRGADDWVTA